MKCKNRITLRYPSNLTGLIFSKLFVLKRDEVKSTNAIKYWSCLCVCGNEVSVARSNLTNGNSKSCGCLRLDSMAQRFKTHGKTKSLTYNSWRAMKARCLQKANNRYKNYGKKGVRVCESWAKSFEAFIKDMGERPSKAHSIDRVNPFGNYEKTNCRWATHKEQANNRTNNKIK